MIVSKLIEALELLNPDLEVVFCDGYWYEPNTSYTAIEDVAVAEWPHQRVIIGAWTTNDGIRRI